MREPGRGRIVAAVVTAGAAMMLVVGCGGATPPPVTAPPVTAPPVSPPGAPEPTIPVAGEALRADQARALQDAVDAGRQPWRLDPVAVARAFVDGLPGWEGARVAPIGPTTVEVTAPGRRDPVLLRLGQPVREGPTGVWVVQGRA